MFCAMISKAVLRFVVLGKTQQYKNAVIWISDFCMIHGIFELCSGKRGVCVCVGGGGCQRISMIYDTGEIVTKLWIYKITKTRKFQRGHFANAFISRLFC